MVCYKRNILLLSLLNYVEHWNDTWTDNIQSFKLLFELPFLLQIELEVNLLDSNANGLENEWKKGVETPHSSPHCIDMLKVLENDKERNKKNSGPQVPP